MRSKRASNLSLNAYSRRRKRKTKLKISKIPDDIIRLYKPKLRTFTATPRSTPRKRKGTRSPFVSAIFFTSPRRVKIRTPDSKPRPPKLRKSLFRDVLENFDKRETCDFEETVDDQDTSKKNVDEPDLCALWKESLDALQQKGLDKTILNFLSLVRARRFPLDNLALTLFKDVVDWYMCTSTNEMRYSRESKIFWKLGYRLFGGRFLHFMGGSKNQGQTIINPGRELSPQMSNINFAVPNEKILRSFDPYLLQNSSADTYSPGVLYSMIRKLKDSITDIPCCLTFDGKKLKQGLTPTSGDVDLLGFEPGMSLSSKQDHLEARKRPIQAQLHLLQNGSLDDISELASDYRTSYLDALTDAHKRISFDIFEILSIKKKKQYAKEKLIERCGEPNWKNSRYAMAISSMFAFIHDINEYLNSAKEVLEELITCVACLNGTADQLLKGSEGDLLRLDNYSALTSVEIVDTRQIKQRTEAWFDRRKCAKVTGSSIFCAIGLDGIKRQQNYFDTLVCGCNENRSASVSEFLKYGTDNEPSAMITLSSKVVPFLFPNKMCCEEGFIELGRSANDRPFMIVSPDGSLRDESKIESTKVGVELKCPVMDIHQSFPARYFLQCQAEIKALNVQKLVYLSWKPDVSSVFLVHKHDELFSRAYVLAEKLYNTESPKRTRTVHSDVRGLKQDINKACQDENVVEFVGLFPSVIQKVNHTNQFESNSYKVCRAEMLLSQIIKLFDEKHQLLREKATEAIVFLCSTMERGNSANSVTAPVCWFTRGYSLDSGTMRNIANHVSDACNKIGLHIPATSFDGQWHVLAVRDEHDKPLTKLQLQKDVWKEVEQMKKQTILSELSKLNKSPKWVKETDKEGNIVKIVVENDALTRLPKFSVRAYSRFTCNEDKNAAQAEPDNQNIKHQNKSKRNAENQSETIDKYGDFEKVTDNCDDRTTEDIDDHIEHETINEAKEPNDAVLNDREATVVLKMLRTDANANKRGIWDNRVESDIQESLKSVGNLEKLRDVDLKVFVRYFKKLGHSHMKESGSKRNKIDSISTLINIPLGNNRSKKTKPINKQRHVQIKNLKDIAFGVVSKTRKAALNVVYAEYLWPEKLKAWQENAFKIKTNLYDSVVEDKYHNSETQTAFSTGNRNTFVANLNENKFNEFFYKPSYSSKRNQSEVSCVDSSHLLTRTRRKCCKGGLDGCSNNAWMCVAKTGKTNLSVAMVECALDPMSVPIAVAHFSEVVENEMRSRGFHHEADLVHDIRNWWKAEDDPGIPALTRIKLRSGLRRRLLKYVQFEHFPPPGMFVRGWPLQLWEALIANIDAKTLLYSLIKTNAYNTRAFSSLMGETFFSELTLYDRRGQGTVSTSEFEAFMGTAVEKLHIRLDRERCVLFL